MSERGLEDRLRGRGLDWIVPAWDAPPGVGAFVTTRNGLHGAPFDVGPAALDALDEAARAHVLADRAFVASLLPSAPRYLDQVHGADVARIGREGVDARWPRADAAVTFETDVVLAVRVADCLPVLLADDAGTVVAAAHAGWRGLAAGVLEATVRSMDVPAARLCAWIGPGIGPQAFEVGADVLEAFARDDAHALAHFAPHGEGKWRADLPALAQRRLAAIGVTRVAASGLCTASDADRFWSYRRDRSRGRMAAYVWRASGRAPGSRPV